MILWGGLFPGGHVAATLANLLSEAEEHLNSAKAETEKLRKSKLANLTKVFGVPVVRRNEISAIEGQYT